MATIGGNALTLLDVAKMTDPDGKVAQIVEILAQANGMFEDMIFEECNDGDSHQDTIATGLPTTTWRRYNEGVQPSKGTNVQVRFQTAMAESRSVIDVDLANKGGNAKGYRAKEARKHIMGMAQSIEQTLIYGDERVDISKFTGLAPHYATVNTATAASAENVVDAGGTGSDNTSIYLVCWGDIIGLYPRGSRAGLEHTDRGMQRITDANGAAGAAFDAYEDVFKAKLGLAVRNWTQAVRIANIDISNLTTESSAADLVKKMIIASEKINPSMGKCAWYMNRKVRTMLRIQQLNKATSQITFDTVAGKKVMAFDEIVVRTCDSLLNTEARVV